MTKSEFEPSSALPTAPPPPYDATFNQPPYNPNVQVSQLSQYQQPPLTYETPLQGGQAHYPPQPQYPPQVYYPQPAQPHVVTETTVMVGAPLLVGPNPLKTTCPNCRTEIRSHTTIQHKGITHLLCLGLCLIGCCLCSCIPYCVDSLKEVRHTCPKCKAHLGTYKS